MCELDTEILTFTDQEKSCLYYYLDSEAILLTFELIVIVSPSTSMYCQHKQKNKKQGRLGKDPTKQQLENEQLRSMMARYG